MAIKTIVTDRHTMVLSQNCTGIGCQLTPTGLLKKFRANSSKTAGKNLGQKQAKDQAAKNTSKTKGK